MYIKYSPLYKSNIYKDSQNTYETLILRFLKENDTMEVSANSDCSKKSMVWARSDLNRRPTGYEPVAPPV